MARRSSLAASPAWPDGFPRPVVVVSKCLEFEACRYNGQAIRVPFIRQLEPHVEIKTVCPEVELGLGVPRDPIRLVTMDGGLHLIQPSTGMDLTEKMATFSSEFLGAVSNVDGFVLKSRSPSCGIKDTKVHAVGETPRLIGKGAGLFGAAVLEHFPNAAVEDEGRLTNPRLRHHFLIKLFALASFRAVKRARATTHLVQFHTANKLTLLAYRQASHRVLGRIVANHARLSIDDVLTEYGAHLARARAHPARPTSHINVLMHAMGYFSDRLSRGEKAGFLDALGEYRAGREALTDPLAVMQSWITRFDDEYLGSQRYFAPYPQPLRDLGDSRRPTGSRESLHAPRHPVE